VKVGDLVKYNYGPAQDEAAVADYWGAKQGELGVIMDICWHGDPDVAEILWFNKYGLQRSYKKYLEIISKVENKKVLDKQ